ncbi:unnamed protein product [Peniophora sp. CBMAI 1063]|nr:unnamed protein product [Peniophora sp. CBMAI 1063]
MAAVPFAGRRRDILENHLALHDEHQAAKTLDTFWPIVMTAFKAEFPGDDVPDAAKDANGKKPLTLRKRIKQWYNNARRRRNRVVAPNAPASTEAAAHDAPAPATVASHARLQAETGGMLDLLSKPNRKQTEGQYYMSFFFDTNVVPTMVPYAEYKERQEKAKLKVLHQLPYNVKCANEKYATEPESLKVELRRFKHLQEQSLEDIVSGSPQLMKILTELGVMEKEAAERARMKQEQNEETLGGGIPGPGTDPDAITPGPSNASAPTAAGGEDDAMEIDNIGGDDVVVGTLGGGILDPSANPDAITPGPSDASVPTAAGGEGDAVEVDGDGVVIGTGSAADVTKEGDGMQDMTVMADDELLKLLENVREIKTMQRERAICKLEGALAKLMRGVVYHTGYSISIIVGGPNPGKNGETDVAHYHSGPVRGTSFLKHDRDLWNDSIVPAFKTFLNDTTESSVRDTVGTYGSGTAAEQAKALAVAPVGNITIHGTGIPDTIDGSAPATTQNRPVPYQARFATSRQASVASSKPSTDGHPAQSRTKRTSPSASSSKDDDSQASSQTGKRRRVEGETVDDRTRAKQPSSRKRTRARGKEGERTLDEDSDLEDREGLQDDDGWGPSDIPPPRSDGAGESDEEYATSAEDDNVPSDWSDQGSREPWDLDPKRRHYRTGKRLSDEEYRRVQQSTTTPQKFKKVRNRRVLSLEQREREREGRQPYRPDWMLARKRRMSEGGSGDEDAPPRQRQRLEDQPAEGRPEQATPASPSPAMEGPADTGGLPVPSGNAVPTSTTTNTPASGIISLPGAKEQEPTPRTRPTSIGPEPTPGPTSEPTPKPAPAPVLDPSRESTPRPAPEGFPKPATELAPEPAPQPTPEPAPQPTPEPVPQPTPGPAPESARATVPDPQPNVAHGGKIPLGTPSMGESHAAGATLAPIPVAAGPKPRPRPKPVQRKKPSDTSSGPASAQAEGDVSQTQLKDGEARNGREDAIVTQQRSEAPPSRRTLAPRSCNASSALPPPPAESMESGVQNQEELDAVLAPGFDGRSLAGVVDYIKTLEISQRASERDLVVSVLESLAPLSSDPRWESILKRWAYLECQLGFPLREDPGHKLSTTSRPGQCSWWMRNARRKLTTVPDIRKEELNAYGESMRGWFRSWMPAWRSPGKAWPLLREKPEGETWARARKGGAGGVFVAVIAVGWWIKQAVTTSARKQAWAVADDLLWALGELSDLDN